jgi:hypothetical protein
MSGFYAPARVARRQQMRDNFIRFAQNADNWFKQTKVLSTIAKPFANMGPVGTAAYNGLTAVGYGRHGRLNLYGRGLTSAGGALRSAGAGRRRMRVVKRRKTTHCKCRH